jgi:4-diphosphocytidyl-2-C-methyl-D-erythritol kinase
VANSADSRLNSSYSCPTKINLGLEVLRQRHDGYHEINTLFLRVPSPADTIEVTPSDEFRLTISDPSLPIDENNLVMKAVRAFSRASELPAPPLHLHLNKQIPMGAGLGGGSSNAATALRICNNFYGTPTDSATLLDISASVGADVPFFVSDSRVAVAGGIGDVLTPVEIDLPYWLLIVKPESVSISTRDAYAAIKPKNSEGTDLLAALRQRVWVELANDFEQAIFPLSRLLPAIKQQMYELGAVFASMSGSGSAIYGLFEDEVSTLAAMSTFQRDALPCWLSDLRSGT